jgi:methylase of polypeptide subunit release factors
MLIEESPYVREKLDGFGSILKYPFVTAVERLGRRFGSAFEWCSGIGEIGMALLRKDLCARLTLSDINPEAIKIAREIAARDGLEQKIDFFVGDNMTALPADLKFDLVVANPPNYFNIQEAHPYGKIYANDLRPNDRGWKLHEAFYATIGKHLLPEAVMLIEEVEPYKQEVFFPTSSGYAGPYDVRTEAPIAAFERMTAKNGLKIEDVSLLTKAGDISLYVLKIKQAPRDF